jgi:hypothetical protein
MTKKDLLNLMIQYTEALTHNKPEEVPVSKNCKATYQGVQKPFGTGDVWGFPRRIPYRQTFVDPVTNTACFSGTVTNNVNFKMLTREQAAAAFGPQKWWIYFVRLQADESGKICEIEEIARPETSAGLSTVPAMMEKPYILETPLAEEDKSTREEMARIASLYWDGVQKLIPPELVPFHPDARRVEVGTLVSDEFDHYTSVRTQCSIPTFWWECIKRRNPVIDVNTGILISMTHMLAQDPCEPTGYVTDIFKIENGMIKYIYAFHDWQIEFVDWEGVGPQTTAELDAMMKK